MTIRLVLILLLAGTLPLVMSACDTPVEPILEEEEEEDEEDEEENEEDDEEDEGDDEEALEFWPFDVGNTWTYGVEEYWSHRGEDTYTWTLEVATVTKEDHEHKAVELWSITDGDTLTIDVSVTPEEVRLAGLILRKDAQPGDEYSYELGESMVHVSVSEATATVPAGSFKGLLFDLDMDESHNVDRYTYLVVPGLGFVYSTSEAVFQGNEFFSEIQLEEYELK